MILDALYVQLARARSTGGGVARGLPPYRTVCFQIMRIATRAAVDRYAEKCASSLRFMVASFLTPPVC